MGLYHQKGGRAVAARVANGAVVLMGNALSRKRVDVGTTSSPDRVQAGSTASVIA